MATTNISLVNNVTEVTLENNNPKSYAGAFRSQYSFNDRTELQLIIDGDIYQIPLEDLRVAGIQYDTVDEALTALSSQFPSSGDGGVTIYTGDGSLSGDRTVDLSNYALSFSNNSEALFYIDSSTALIKSFKNTDGGNKAYYQGQTDIIENDAHSYFHASFNDETKLAEIVANANVDSSSLSYTADTHTFNVGITITELSGIGIRAIAVDADGKIVLL